MTDNTPLLKVDNLKTWFYLTEGIVRAVDGADFQILRGQTLGVVGESGCGKSVTARSILRIVPKPGRVCGGRITLFRRRDGGGRSTLTEEVDLTGLDPKGDEMRSIRGGEIALVPQEPMTSLSPVYTIGNQIIEAIVLHRKCSKKEAREIGIDTLSQVGMPRPSYTIDRYSFELSGGMRQRAMIAMALVCRPSLLIADEPTTALDVTIESQILRLLRRLQSEMGMAMMFITHNLGVIAQMADQVIVMYLGKVMETAPVKDLFYDTRHPYTQALLRSIPRLGKSARRLEVIAGAVPDPYAIPKGCPFHPRCRKRIRGVCEVAEPPVITVGEGHDVRCVLYR